MLHITSKKSTLLLCFCAISVLFTPSIALSASETGSVAANQAADQKAALAKKAADRQAKKAAKVQVPAEKQKKNAEEQNTTTAPISTEEQKEK
ncbi:hypothetical protein [Methylobacter psychrophilus]|uniref:hypothetical protein n=1 Tax=Methylobacter psychrophilus TaxID=96941 RepID=UPI0021D49F9C|nr:hypothetical protein [Methylobacter psychrophilus]